MMKNIHVLALAFLCIVAGILVCGCTRQPAAPAQAPPAQPTTQVAQPGAGIANPASVNCDNLGGRTKD